MMTPEEVITTIKQAANTLYAIGWDQVTLDAEKRQQYRQLSERLDQVTKALGGNPMTPAWDIPGNQRIAGPFQEEPDGLLDEAPNGPCPPPVVDLMAALEDSLAKTKASLAQGARVVA